MVEKIRINKNTEFGQKPVCACIGYFDGMHRGHQELIFETVSQAKKLRCQSALISFTPDPLEIIKDQKCEHLFPDSERERLCDKFGLDLLIEITFDKEVMNLEPDLFIERYLNNMHIKELVCGNDFSFGCRGKGHYQDLVRKGNFHTTVIPEKCFNGKRISSTWIRDEIRKGNFGLAEELLGFKYYFICTVVSSCQKQGKWLSEAVLADDSVVIPADGNYEGFYIRDKHFYYDDTEYREKGSDLIIYAGNE